MYWTPFHELIQQYRQQIKVIDQKIQRLRQQIGHEKKTDEEHYSERKETVLCSMRSDLYYGIHLMSKYKNDL